MLFSKNFMVYQMSRPVPRLELDRVGPEAGILLEGMAVLWFVDVFDMGARDVLPSGVAKSL